MRNVVGPVVTEDDFFDRRIELARLRSAVVRQNLLLLAPRRVGKSSLLNRLRDDLEQTDGFHATYVSVEGVRDEVDFVRELFRAVEAQAGLSAARRGLRRLRRLFRRTEEVEIAAAFKLKLASTEASAWQDRADELGELLQRLDGHWFYLVDELPVFVLRILEEDPSGKRARAFLEWFRALRQRLSMPVAFHHWVLAGSIGLDTVAARHGLSATINDLATERLGPFAGEDARAFLRALAGAEDVALSDAVIERMVERVGWLIPFHLQLLFAKLRAARDRNEAELTSDDVDDAVEGLLRDRKDFDGWRERLDQELGPVDARGAFELLKLCAADPAGARRDVLASTLGPGPEDARRLQFLLDALETDGYLIDQDGRYRFQSPLLREFWLRRYA